MTNKKIQEMLSIRRAQSGLLRYPVIAFILALVLFFLFTAPDIDDYIGWKQAGVLGAVGIGEQKLSFIDSSARLAAWESLFLLGEHGGFYSDPGDDLVYAAENYPCERYGYVLWNSGSEKCWPYEANTRDSFKYYFGDSFKGFLAQHPEKSLSSIDYNYLVSYEGGLRISGLTENKLTIPITGIKAEKKSLPPLSIPDDEPITRCCSGECIVNIAEQYQAKYGAGSSYSLPYVWGGETPYNIDQTQDKTEDPNSFFYGVSVTDFMPEPHDDMLTEPGFDCSGFVWWVYKHAAIPGFNSRLSAEEYEQLAKQSGQEVCGYSRQCTQELLLSKSRPGDLVFKHNQKEARAGHIAIYAGNNQIIDSSSGQNGIAKRELPDSWSDSAHISVYRLNYNSGCSAAQSTDSEQEAEEEDGKAVLKSGSGSAVMLGDLSAKYESGSGGSKAVGYDTTGKTSYGKYQLASGTGTVEQFLSFLESRSPELYAKLKNAGSPNCEYACEPEECYLSDDRSKKCAPSDCFVNCEFAKVWKQEAGKGSLEALEHDFIKATLYDPAVNGIRAECSGLLVNERSFALQNVVWSTAVQHGARGAVNIFREAEVSPDMSDQEIIKAVYNERSKIDKYFSRSSNAVKKALRNRFEDEKKTALEWLGSGVQGAAVTTNPEVDYFSEQRIGNYRINPDFYTTVDFNMSIYEHLADWARMVYKKCSGTQKELSVCVDQQVELLNNAYDEIFEECSESKLGLTECVRQKQMLMNSAFKNLFGYATAGADFNLTFGLFYIEDNAYCDGDKAAYYEFIEAFEDCLALGNPHCYCELPSPDRLQSFRIDNQRITLIDENGVNDYYWYADKQPDTNQAAKPGTRLFANDQELKELVVDKDGKGIQPQFFFKDSLPGAEAVEGALSDRLFLVKQPNGLEVFSEADIQAQELPSCRLEQKKSRFRFCAMTPYKAYNYIEDYGYEQENIYVKFALDLYNPPPPPVTPDAEPVDKDREEAPDDESVLAEEKECEGFGKADIELDASTMDLQPNYESFIINLASDLVPQLKVLLFAKNYLATVDSVPALVNVKIDLKASVEGCDVSGLVYKCGIGTPPYHDGVFDFSNPTGYVDLSAELGSSSAVSLDQPNACMMLKNPDGSFSGARYTRSVYDGQALSFSVDRCASPILQYKKMSGMDIISSALHGFGYYFAFAYVDSAGNYGPVSIEMVEIPSVLNQLEDQLGIKNLLIAKDIIMGDYDRVFGLLGIEDEWNLVRRALAQASLDRLLVHLKGEAMRAAYNTIADEIKNPDARMVFDDLAYNGRLDRDYARILADRAIDELDSEDFDQWSDLLRDRDFDDAYYYVKQLPLETKRELLASLYDKQQEAEKVRNLAEREVDRRLYTAMREREKALRILRELDPEQRIEFLSELADDRPEVMLERAANLLGENEKAEAVRDALRTADSARSGLARIIAHSSPDYVKRAAFDYIVNNVPGYEEYKNILNIFRDFESPSCG